MVIKKSNLYHFKLLPLVVFLSADVSNLAVAFAPKGSLLESPGQTIHFRSKDHLPPITVCTQKSAFGNGCKSVSGTTSRTTSALLVRPKIFGLIEWNDVLYDDTSLAFDAWEWTSNMGAPAALIAAAVLVTLSETRLATAPVKTDKRWIRFTKRLMRFLLMSSFALEVASIFVGNMTGSMLLGHGGQSVASKVVGYSAPLQLVHHHHELEYLITQITFLQGLIHWLGSVVCDLLLPHPAETTSAKRMNKCLASWLITLIISIISFYNRHVNFYSGYGTMLARCIVLIFSQGKTFQPMSLFYIPSCLVSIALTWRAFTSPREED